MKKSLIKIFYLTISLLLLLPACTAYKNVTYAKDAMNETSENKTQAESRIYPKDLITIVVNTSTPEAAVPFNLALTPTNIISNTSVNSAIGLQSYLVENDGTIVFPVVGRIEVAGKTKKEVENLIKEKIYPKYIIDEPIIQVRFVNYKISVLGEVNKPGSFNINNERVSIFDALALAGDMTIYGKRKNVLVIREKLNGEKEMFRLDLQSKNIMQSPCYYIQQNDVVYVEPNKHKGNSSAISAVETLSISVTSTLISLTSLIITVLK